MRREMKLTYGNVHIRLVADDQYSFFFGISHCGCHASFSEFLLLIICITMSKSGLSRSWKGWNFVVKNENITLWSLVLHFFCYSLMKTKKNNENLWRAPHLRWTQGTYITFTNTQKKQNSHLSIRNKITLLTEYIESEIYISETFTERSKKFILIAIRLLPIHSFMLSVGCVALAA